MKKVGNKGRGEQVGEASLIPSGMLICCLLLTIERTSTEKTFTFRYFFYLKIVGKEVYFTQIHYWLVVPGG